MKVNPYKHPFIVIEGIDGCGKSTLIKGVKKWDKKHKIGSIFTKEPTDGYWGKMIRMILDNNGYDVTGEKVSPKNLQTLYINDRLEHRISGAAFLEMYPLFSDRDFPSTVAYGVAAGLSRQWILQKHEEILRDYFFIPDLFLILNLPAEEAIKRIKKTGKHEDYFEKLDFLKKVRDCYLAFPRWIKEMHPDVNFKVQIIDASLPPQEVLENSFFWIDRVFQEKLEATEYIKIFKRKGGK